MFVPHVSVVAATGVSGGLVGRPGGSSIGMAGVAGSGAGIECLTELSCLARVGLLITSRPAQSASRGPLQSFKLRAARPATTPGQYWTLLITRQAHRPSLLDMRSR